MYQYLNESDGSDSDMIYINVDKKGNQRKSVLYTHNKNSSLQFDV